ncbi:MULTISPECIES: RraA family protein [unclassified Schlesneria]|uniref:RraA family protein n=1 Tax=Schlesneria TaxID=656899 RepID=UPI002F1473CF
MSAQGLTAAQLDELRKFDSPTICNAVELWNLRPRNTGYMNSSIKACFPSFPPMVGYALTSTFRSMAPPRGGDAYGSIGAQLDAFATLPGPPVIVFQDLDEPSASATFGEVMCSTYKRFGAQGLITSGTGRDLAQVEALGFPTFTNGACAAHGYCHIVSINGPVTVGGMVIYPGDLLHGDLNGVTTIPAEIASEVPEVCQEIARAEAIVLDYLKSEKVSVAEFNVARKACGDAINALGKRLRGE